MNKYAWSGKVLSGTQTRLELEVRADAEAIEKCCLLGSSSQLAQPAFLQNLGASAQGDTTHNDLGPLPSITN